MWALYNEKMTFKAIAKVLKTTPNSVRNTVTHLKKCGCNLESKPKPGRPVTIVTPQQFLDLVRNKLRRYTRELAQKMMISRTSAQLLAAKAGFKALKLLN